MSTVVNFKFARNAPFTCVFVSKGSNGAAHNFTGSTFRMQVKARDANGDPTGAPLLTRETGSGIAGTLAAGEIIPTFPAQSLSVGVYVYDLLRLESGAVKERIWTGTITVVSGVTEAP